MLIPLAVRGSFAGRSVGGLSVVRDTKEQTFTEIISEPETGQKSRCKQRRNAPYLVSRQGVTRQRLGGTGRATWWLAEIAPLARAIARASFLRSLDLCKELAHLRQVFVLQRTCSCGYRIARENAVLLAVPSPRIFELVVLLEVSPTDGRCCAN